jgi:N-acyl homoserine lactone hydrolase
MVNALPTITAIDCGWIRQKERVLIAVGGDHEIDIPVPSWLVRHEQGDVLFDVGLHASLATSTESLGWLAKIFTPILDESGTIGPRLRERDIDPAGALTVVISHCHYDHVGGLSELPNARVIVQADEWAAAMSAEDLAEGYDRALYDLGHDVVTVDGEHDIFGDGTVLCWPTPGHTCGHQSLKVETDRGPTILTADACYFEQTLADGRLPGFGYDLEQQARSLDLLRREQQAGTTIIPGHDPVVFRAMIDG